MARRFFKKFMPAASRIHEDRLLRGLGRLLHSPRLWQLNRDTVARGVGWGLFWAFMPIPGQTVLATLCAIPTRGNVPLAIALTWVSNPLTAVLWIYVAYRIGLFLTGQPALPNMLPDLMAAFSAAGGGGFWQSMRYLGSYVRDNLGILWPFFLGSVVLSVLAGAGGYCFVRAMWRWNVSRRWRTRGHRVRCHTCFRTVVPRQGVCGECRKPLTTSRRIGHGLASVARRAGRIVTARPAGIAPDRDASAR
ncbi:MAG TPA: DUF2062 domain-containing protein [Tepidisphaeraceae bacterium]|nr:DUF2062 domain-containing protein [Tepidisphaeraceae bacterium]